ncbi:MAG: LamG-like jellyroll fold domain-containing protein, partial [Ignavibacteria bacterium]
MKARLIILLLLSFVLICNSSKAQMNWNQACSFAGTGSSYIAVRNSSTTNITGSFTLEAWVNLNIFNGFSKGVICKGGPVGAAKIYGMRLQSTGRFDVWTNGALRLTSNNSCPLNQWTHIAASYNASTNTFSLFFNGALDNSVVIAGAAPVSNTDSLFIGAASSATPFSGMLDEVRVWNRALTFLDITRNMRVSLGTKGGFYYNGLIMSMTFQSEAYAGNVATNSFSLNDYSGNFNFGVGRSITDVDLSDLPSKTIATNLCLDLSFGSDYLACPDHPNLSPTTGVTLEAWIYPRTNFDRSIIHKGPATGGAATNYSLNIINQKLAGKINGAIFDSQDTIALNKWSHVAFTCWFDGIFRYYSFYVNGKRVRGGINPAFGGSITDGPDSLYIGGTGFLTSFNGFIDEVKIAPYSKPQSDIEDSLYTSLQYGYPYTNNVAYNFDGYTWCNTLAAPFLSCRNSPVFANPSIYSEYPVSPLNRSNTLPFQNGFIMKRTDNRIPASGSTGMMADDTLNVLLDKTVSDVNVYVALNHKDISTLQLSLIAPDGSTVQLMNSNTLVTNADHVITIFDDQASLPMANNTYATFSPSIRPISNLNSGFTGINSKGNWRLAVNDLSGLDTGRLYAWGLQFNNNSILPKVLGYKSLIQGFYDPASNTMIRDTAKCYLRNSFAPYSLVDSGRSYLNTDGSGTFTFFSTNILKSTAYLLQLKHRNSIETWSNTGGTVFD